MKNALRLLPADSADTGAVAPATRFPSAPVVLTSASRTRPAASADGNAHKHLVTMKTVSLLSSLGALSVATTLFLNASAAQAQERPGGPGGFNPEQMRERMLERLRESFDVKDDAEWKLISERIAKVMDTRRAAGGMGGGPGLGGGPGGPGGQRGFGGGRPSGGDDSGGPNGGRPPQGERGQGGPGGGPGGFNRQADPEAEALQKSLEAKAPTEEIKAKLAKLRDARRAKEAQLDKAQEELRQILSVRQEAVAVAAGLLK
ncbi:MAG: protein product from transcript [Limisphaerales bacterium]|nr:MAG: protein product from transcript [Limisphaerales bacterium]KAG0510206.1 MAG: protein product from transcript [Limisphaerales bacterium]TXT51911.1 MAG: protein product from transcript [Limisphaerales bacterium]